MTEALMGETADAGPLAQPTAAAYYARARGLLFTPTAEWTRIAEERPTARDLFLRWVLPLSAAFFLAPQLGAIAFPPRIAGVVAAPSLAQALYTVLAGTVFMAAGVWALAWLIDALAKYFDGRSDPAQATKLVAYSGTGLWLTGLFGLLPPLELAMAAGVVSIFTLYRGLPILMKAPADRALPYAAAVTGVGAVLCVTLMALSSCMAMFSGPPARAPAPAAVMTPAKVQPAAAPSGAALEVDKLRRLLPDAMPGGWVRQGVNTNNGGALGFTGPTVAATYAGDGKRLVLSVTDVGAAGAQNPIATLQATRPDQDDARGLVRHEPAVDRYGFTAIDRSSGVARRLVVIGDRVVLYAEGSNLADLEAALALIDTVRAAQIARGL